MKRLIVCCDGTWNRADHVDHGKPAPTNVWKLKLAIDTATDAAVRQLVHYEEGVGTRRWEHLSGGGMGIGLSRNVQDCYAFLVDNYEPGDELFFFGFSRGAFTARSLAGLVRNSGILSSEHRDKVKDAYKLYRSRKADDAPSANAAADFRRAYSCPDADITFIGVWDTVGALGIPIDGFRPPWLTNRWAFHDTTLSRFVKNAYHAISIDERRRPFEPTLWVRRRQPDGSFEALPEGQTVRQVWFTGVHADVGGGYSESSLSEIPLRWLARRAAGCGLVLKPGHLVVTAGDIDEGERADGCQIAPDPLGDPHDSLTWFYKLLRPYDRGLRARDGEAVDASLASSARKRYDDVAAYRPPGLEQWVKGVLPETGVDG